MIIFSRKIFARSLVLKSENFWTRKWLITMSMVHLLQMNPPKTITTTTTKPKQRRQPRQKNKDKHKIKNDISERWLQRKYVRGSQRWFPPTVEPLLWDSRITSIQGTQNLVLEKRPDNICIYYLYLRDTSFPGKETLLGPKTQKKCPLP